MRWRNTSTPTYAGSAGSNGKPAATERLDAVDDSGNVLAYLDKAIDGTVSLTVDGNAVVAPSSIPEVPAAPTEQDIVDALIALGLVTQAEA